MADHSRDHLFLLIVPAPLAIVTISLATSAFWPIALATGAAAIGATVWGIRNYRNEQADEALSRARDETETDPDTTR
ncbi:hypothetical protein [Microbacterium sp. NPDC079995]|uniref:hypothetical protein n=1 Tax=unclassified Microbacterium TaxID=2609290 RepID=UPI00344C1B8C